MSYMHGIRVQENPTSMPTPVQNEAGVPVIFGTAPVNLAQNPEGTVNKLFLCNTFTEAAAAVGYSKDYEKYTLCQAMDAFFKVFGIGPVVLCNVLDPAVHKASYTESLNLVDGQAVTKESGIMLQGLSVSNGDNAMSEGSDYTVAFDDEGHVVVTVLTSGISAVTLTGSRIDPTKVTYKDIIGSYDADTGAESGTELVRMVYPMFNIPPSLLLAPGWSQDPRVGLALAEKCADINGDFVKIS